MSTKTATDPATDVAAAERRELLARERLTETMQELQAKLNPKVIARDVTARAVDSGKQAARNGADMAQRNPGAIAGAVAVIGLFLARHRIAKLFRRKPKKVPAAPINHGDTHSTHSEG